MLALAACGILASGCGSGSSTSTSSSAASTNTAVTKASAPITSAQAVAFAHAVNLRSADVPKMRSHFSEGEAVETASRRRSSAAFVNCYGGPEPTLRLAKIRSPEFSAGDARQSKSVESRVEVWSTSNLSDRNNATYFSSRGRACFLHYLSAAHKQLNKQRTGRLEFGSLRIATLPNPLPGVSHSFLRTIAETLVHRKHVRVHIYHDIFTFISGPAEIELEATGYARPVPAATEERLLLALVSRAKANEL
jgi:hypothetical protein